MNHIIVNTTGQFPSDQCAVFKLCLPIFLGVVLCVSAAMGADGLPELKYLPEKTVALGTAKVSRIVEWGPVQKLRKLGLFDENDIGLGPFIFDDLAKIERIVVAIDQPFINELAAEQGLTIDGQPPATTANPDGNLMNLGLAFYNYLSIHERFPRANGDGNGRQTGLSWRVHLLPLLDEEPLFKQFRLNEPWDSEHNKKLILKMPQIFAVDGVKAPGKTSIHVIGGKRSAFPDKALKGTRFEDLIDGTSGTVFAVQADPATAVEWTKPGGLVVDEKNPLACVGKFPDAGMLVVLGDGSVRAMSSRISREEFLASVTIAGGESVPEKLFESVRPSLRAFPTVVITFKEPIELSRLESMATSKRTVGRQTLYLFNGLAVWPTTPFSLTTVIVSKAATLEAKLKAGTMTTIKREPLAEQLDTSADLSIVANIQSQKSLLNQLIERMPTLRSMSDYQVLTQHLRFTSLKAGDVILRSTGTCASAKLAATKADEMNQQMQLVKSLVPALMADIPDEADRKMIAALAGGLRMEVTGNKITTLLIAPAGIERLPQYFEPAIISAMASANATKERNNLKQIGLAFHNSHDAFGRFPSSSRTTNPDDSKALSWRVHILPYVDEYELYKKFRLDEPWDSPHNLKLAERMPVAYKTRGVAEANKTSMHLIAGEGTPFDKEHAPHIRDFKDGLSNTLMVIIAGPDKAEIWTKPGGLPIDPKEPVKSLGNIGEQGTNALNGDGSIRKIDADIAPETLLNLVRHNDGK